MIQGAIDLYTELLPSHGKRDEWGSTSLTNQPCMMRTSSERKYLLHNGWSQSCFLLPVALGEEREHIGKEKSKPGMGSGVVERMWVNVMGLQWLKQQRGGDRGR